MLKVDFSKLNIDSFKILKSKLDRIKRKDTPDFAAYSEDVDGIKRILKPYQKRFRNLIVIGNGGSNTSFKAFSKALVPMDSRKKAFILTTMEPDLINEMKKNFSKRDTLIMPISKSGSTIGVLEATLAFKGYSVLPVTSAGDGALARIAEKQSLDMIPHPEIGGRYSGLTASGIAPAVFMGIDTEEIIKGAKSMYKRCAPHTPLEKNPALKLASALFLLDKKGYDEIFCPIYSYYLTGFSNLIVQLMHESVGKKKKGQTIFCAEAPESQHHTNQRFFGGKKNILGLFHRVKEQKDKILKVSIPDTIRDLKVRKNLLGDANNVPYAKALEFEFLGTYRDAIRNRIPSAVISIDKVSPFAVGELIAFWQYVAVYSSWLRDVNAFDQPQVESSKDISMMLRKKYRKD